MGGRHEVQPSAIVATSAVTVDLKVERGIGAHQEAFAGAVARLRTAAAATDIDEAAGRVHAALAEAINWLASIAERIPLQSDLDVQALLYARNRVQHQFASAVENAGSGWTWRATESLPANPNRPDTFRRPMYEQRLARKPLLEVFDRIKLPAA